ncbi:hypothetical protein AAEO56_01825 [Flavobacterium sp. DGU11]|uniref:Uncharacterized protein n=1 Tax=Flavobacterium arundinis TaxID=3139143 RepID=A0ABU9HS54_9FLAO
MGRETILHGRIALTYDKAEQNASRSFISTLKNDDSYPWIRKGMFGFGPKERPYYYERPIIGFAANYKALEPHFTAFIIKFEHVLRNIHFLDVKLQMETEYFGTYNFYWRSKTHYADAKVEDKLVETDEWFFGQGYRSMHGTLGDDANEYFGADLGFIYPVIFEKEVLDHFDKAFEDSENLTVGEKIYIPRLFEYKPDTEKSKDDKLYDVIVNYAVSTGTEYGWEPGKGYWVKKT